MGENLRGSTRIDIPQMRDNKASSDAVWIKAMILTAGHFNHLMLARTNVVVNEAFRDVDRALLC